MGGTTFGYGIFSAEGKSVRAHRYAWEMVHGPIPRGLFACHRCDNRKCVNPDHLFLGTSRDNMHDMIAKGRARYPGHPESSKGERNGNARLTESQAIEIIQELSTGTCARRLAERYGVTPAMIGHIKHGRNWKHLRRNECSR
jgi:hypothetical protein